MPVETGSITSLDKLAQGSLSTQQEAPSPQSFRGRGLKVTNDSREPRPSEISTPPRTSEDITARHSFTLQSGRPESIDAVLSLAQGEDELDAPSARPTPPPRKKHDIQEHNTTALINFLNPTNHDGLSQLLAIDEISRAVQSHSKEKLTDKTLANIALEISTKTLGPITGKISNEYSPTEMSSRSFGTLLNYKGILINSALKQLSSSDAYKNPDHKHHSEAVSSVKDLLQQYIKLTETFALKKNDPASEEDARDILKYEADQIEKLRKFPADGHTRLSSSEAKHCFEHQKTAVLNQLNWKEETSDIQYKGHTFTSKLTPIPSDSGSFISAHTADSEHVVNLWRTTLEHEGKTVYQAYRHATLSAFGETDGVTRNEKSQSRAKELIKHIALDHQQELLDAHKNGTKPDLKISFTSLLTAGNYLTDGERQMIDEQDSAIRAVSAKGLTSHELGLTTGSEEPFDIIVSPAIFNFGVNELALTRGLKQGNHYSDKHFNKSGLETLFGSVETKANIGGWAKEYLSQSPSPENSQQVKELVTEIKRIWNKEGHHGNGGDPYKLARAVDQLANAIGVNSCYNCKSGKDRTSAESAEGKLATVVSMVDGSIPKQFLKTLTDEQKETHAQLLKEGRAIQYYNYGLPGSKVEKELYGLEVNHQVRLPASALEEISGFVNVRP